MKNNYVSIVINPVAGSGRANRAARNLLCRIKRSADFELNIDFTREKNEATSLTRKAITDGASMVIAVGGDGTVNEVVNGFFLNGKPLNPSCELGIINCGTGGGFAKTLNNPYSTDKQIDLLLLSRSRDLDLGLISYYDYEGKPASRLFINECQAGIGSKVASAVGKRSKRYGGTIAFGFAAAALAMSIKPTTYSVAYEEEDFQELDLIGLVVGNGTQCAGGMKLTPNAKLNDGLFDVLLMKEMTLVKKMLNLSKVYSGRHILSQDFSIRKCKKLRIRTDVETPVESDGEMLGNSPFEMEIMPSAIKIRTSYSKILAS